VAAVASPIGTIGREPELESIARFLKEVVPSVVEFEVAVPGLTPASR